MAVQNPIVKQVDALKNALEAKTKLHEESVLIQRELLKAQEAKFDTAQKIITQLQAKLISLPINKPHEQYLGSLWIIRAPF